MRSIFPSISLGLLATLPLGEAVAAPATALKVCTHKSTGATVARATCKASELPFSEQSYSAGRGSIIYVAKKGAKYKSINAALSSISPAPTAASPIVIKVGPGTFSLSEATILLPYVILEGAGPEATTINIPSSGTISLRSNSALKKVKVKSLITNEGSTVIQSETNSTNVVFEDLSIVLSSSLSIHTGITIGGSSSVARRIKISNPALSLGGTGISNTGSLNTIDDAEITLYGGATGIAISNSPSIDLHNVRITVEAIQGAQTTTGIIAGGATTKLYGTGLKVKADCSLGTVCNALYISGAVDDAVIMNSLLESEGATVGTAAAVDGGTLQVVNSKLIASVGAPPVGSLNASTVKLAGTQLAGSSIYIDGASTITCAGVYDETYTFSASSCP